MGIIWKTTKQAIAEDLAAKHNDFYNILARCGILALTLFLSIFVQFFVWVTLVLAVFFAIIQLNGRSIYYLVFLYPLSFIFKEKASSLPLLYIVALAVFLMLGIKCLYEWFYKKRKINWWFIACVAVVMLMFLWPFSAITDVNIVNRFFCVGILVSAYFFKDDISFKELVLIFFAGILASVFIGLFHNSFLHLYGGLPDWVGSRFPGTLGDPNALALYTMTCMCLVFVLHLTKTLKVLTYPIFVFLLVITVLTLSKSGFLISLALIAAFIVTNLIKHKSQAAIIQGTAIIVLTGIVFICLLSDVNILLGRMIQQSHAFGEPKDIFSYFTTSRNVLWKLYIAEITSSPWTLLFGHNTTTPPDTLTAHNAILQITYEIGLVGVAFILLAVFLAFGKKNFSKINWAAFALVAVVVLLHAMVESLLVEFHPCLLLFCFAMFHKEESKPTPILSTGTIPKTLHLIWFSGEKKPDDIEHCISTWKKVMPDYQIKEWALKDVEEIRKLPENKYLDQALVNKKWAWAADFLRLWILYNEGGIYLDSDVEVLKPLDPFLHHGFFTCYEWNKSVEAAVMGAQKGNRFAGEFLQLYKNKHFVLEEGIFDDEIIPIILADYILRKYQKYRPRNRHTIIDDLHIYPSSYFSPKNTFTMKPKIKANTYVIHHFANMYAVKTKQKTSFRRTCVKTVLYFANFLDYPIYIKLKRFVVYVVKKEERERLKRFRAAKRKKSGSD